MSSQLFHRRRRTLWWACLPALVAGQQVWGQELLRESGNFRTEIDRQKEIVANYFGANANTFIVPTSAERAYFQNLCETLRSGNLTLTASLADAVNYDLVQFKDTAVNRTYYMLRERNNSSRKGWGSFVYNFNYTSDIVVEVPHVLYDQNTEDIGARAMQTTNARSFVMAGAHRACCGVIDDRVGGVSDPTWESATVFQSAHRAFNGTDGKTVAWQIHGFGSSTNAPDGAGAILADGSGRVAWQHRFLDNALEQRDIDSYVYNDYSASGSINREVNATVTSTGTTTYVNGWDLPLNAKQNVQANFSSNNHSGATFVHIELSSTWRNSASNRALVAAAIADASSRVTLTSNYWTGGAGTTTFGNDDNWANGGVPGASEDGLFGATVQGTYYPAPASVLFYYQTQSSRTITWNAPTGATFAAANSSAAATRVWTLQGDGVNNVQPLFWATTNFASGTITFSGTNLNTAGGPPLVIQLGGPGAFRVDSPGATLRIDAQVIESASAGPRTFEKTGEGTVILTNNSNSFTGGVRLVSGTLAISDFRQTGPAPTTLAASHLLFVGGTLSYTGPSARPSGNYGLFLAHESSGGISIADPDTNLTLASPITGHGALIKTGPGKLTIATPAGSITHTGGVLIRQGTLSISEVAAIGPIPSSPEAQLTIDGGTLEWTASTTNTFASSRLATWGGGGATLDITQPTANLVLAQNISGSGRLEKKGPGTLTLTGSNSTTGGFTVSGGTLVTGNTNDLGPVPTVATPDYIHLTGGTFQWSGGTVAFGANRGLSVSTSHGNLRITTGTLTLPGTVSGPGMLTTSGPGSLALTGTVALGGISITGGSVSLASGTMPAPVLASLAIAQGSTLDITSRGLILTDPAQEATLRGLLVAGVSQGYWNSNTGIVSSAVSDLLLRTIGYAANTFGYATFLGSATSPGDLLVAYTHYGDANLDGAVNAVDFAMMLPLGTTGATWAQGDFDYDGVITEYDYGLYQIGVVTSASTVPPIPEPGAVGGGMALLAVMSGRSRRLKTGVRVENAYPQGWSLRTAEDSQVDTPDSCS